MGLTTRRGPKTFRVAIRSMLNSCSRRIPQPDCSRKDINHSDGISKNAIQERPANYVNQIYLHSFCRGLVKLFQHLRLFDHYSFRYCDLHWLFIGLIRDFWVFLAMKLYVLLSTLKHSYFHPHFHLNSSHHFSLGDKGFDKIIGWLFLRFIVYSFFKYLELFFDFPLQAYLFFPDTFDKTQKTSFLLVRNYIFKVPLYEKR